MCGSLQTCAQTDWVRVDVKIAQSALGCLLAPFLDSKQLLLLGAGEQIVLQLEGAVEPIRAKIILPSFEQGGLEWSIQQPADNRDVLLQQLLLEIDGVGRNDRFAVGVPRQRERLVPDKPAICRLRSRLRRQGDDFLRGPPPPRRPSAAVLAGTRKFFALDNRPPSPNIS